ncbi:MAG: hypothetical protein JRI23_07440 [Deltaproteobacteria bacterium]|nr:hypothetical protein [Deltaproteobacteria bacterium]MBW2531427.1 hypothetical protein [Deltaproteobacteria bacterium]
MSRQKLDDSALSVSVDKGVVEVRRDGEVVGHGHWDGRRVVHPDYRMSGEESESVDELVRSALPADAWENADSAADELVSHMSDADRDAMSQTGDAEAWREEVSGNTRARGLDHNAVLRAMYELIKRSRNLPED